MSAKTNFTPEEIQEMIKLYDEGKATVGISYKFNTNNNTVQKLLNENGVILKEWKRKIDPSEFPKIVSMYSEQNMSKPKIAKKYNVSHTIINNILEKSKCEKKTASQAHRKYPLNEHYFDNIDSSEKAYILGFIYADGSNIYKNNYISIDIERGDIDLLYKISERLYSENSHDRIRNYDLVKNKKDGTKRIYYSSVLSFNSKYMCEILNKLGCPRNKSLIVKFPEWLVNEELQRHFIRGYYDGDGGTYVPYKKGYGAQSKIIGTIQFINKIDEIVKKQCDVNTYMEHPYPALNRVCISGNQQVKRFLDWIYNGSTIHLDRKYFEYQKLLNKMDANSRTRNRDELSFIPTDQN